MEAKDRLAIPPQKMPEQEPAERVGNLREVPLGYTPEMAVLEAKRCLHCKRAVCIEGCPVGVDIPGFLAAVAKGDFASGIRIIRRRNVLPAVCGRVCPQEQQCQLACTVGKFHHDPGKSVSIGRIERFLADWERETEAVALPGKVPSSGRSVVVIGSGPAGLTVAGDLVQLGHSVTVLEALHEAGGVLVYGIPEFRLPKAIVSREVKFLEDLGVEFRLNTIAGRTIPLDELMREYDAVFIGSGAGLPRFQGIPGENLLGVYSANEYLTRVNLMRAFDFPNSDTPIQRGGTVITVGGGNVAMDCARTALRMGAERSIVVYRRSEMEMPARREEVHHAREEGVEFHFLEDPVEITGGPWGWVNGVRLVRMTLGEPDSSGRRSSIPVEGSEFVREADTVLVAIGNSPNPLVASSFPELETTRWGGIAVNEATGQTSVRGVFAGGDIVLGAATVILAMGQGRIAARAMHAYLSTGRWEGLEEAIGVAGTEIGSRVLV
ncbi:MAG TPA: NADPH-dependent glutamate synthase [Candidatus Fermentibacter daniensis]|nr:NADPH-dependent glutamate synthase [Candidatus Fermentibacter daniensis]HOG55542.1 NADPH-dependent glutamate synthase [Candidatus Fermentibacter daniensis]